MDLTISNVATNQIEPGAPDNELFKHLEIRMIATGENILRLNGGDTNRDERNVDFMGCNLSNHKYR